MNETRAQRARREFDPRGSNCPICRCEFRTCLHSVREAEARLENEVIASAAVRARQVRTNLTDEERRLYEQLPTLRAAVDMGLPDRDIVILLGREVVELQERLYHATQLQPPAVIVVRKEP